MCFTLVILHDIISYYIHIYIYICIIYIYIYVARCRTGPRLAGSGAQVTSPCGGGAATRLRPTKRDPTMREFCEPGLCSLSAHLLWRIAEICGDDESAQNNADKCQNPGSQNSLPDDGHTSHRPPNGIPRAGPRRVQRSGLATQHIYIYIYTHNIYNLSLSHSLCMYVCIYIYIYTHSSDSSDPTSFSLFGEI